MKHAVLSGSKLIYCTRHFTSIATILVLATMVHSEVWTESAVPLIDERCEVSRFIQEFEERVTNPCYQEVDSCIEERLRRIGETRDHAKDYCWRRPLKQDPQFVGPCPNYYEEVEETKKNEDDWFLPRMRLRLSFGQLNEHNARIDVFNRTDSTQQLRSFLATNPDNPIALKLLALNLMYTDDLVERLKLEIKEHELDPDCPEVRWMRRTAIFNRVMELSDNWLSDSGPGSELSDNERHELLLHTRHTLLNMYDIAVEQETATERLFWALQSVHDSVLTGMFDNLQQISEHFEIDIEDFAEKRGMELVHLFSREYDTDSAHGRSHTLEMMCNDLAFELGLTDHCLKLLDHFGKSDAETAASPSTDWLRSAILLVNALTRDCDEQAGFHLGHAPLWWDNRRCVAEQRETAGAEINAWLLRFPELTMSAERELLQAYLRLDETSDEHFHRAFALDSELVVYAARLSKRVHKRGLTATASNILSRIDTETSSNLSPWEKSLLDAAFNSVREGTYRNSNEPHRDVFFDVVDPRLNQ